MIYEVIDITFKYPGETRKVLDGASVSLAKGEILTILGPNGAGKTTLLNCMAGLLEPNDGMIKICGTDIKDMTRRSIAQLVGYVPQIHIPAFDYSVLDFVIMGCAPRVGLPGKPGKKEIELCEQVLEEMRISDLTHRSYMKLSGGERQQVMIARAIVQQPKVILFDEPTAHLDYGNQHKVLKMVRDMADKGYSVGITTHNPDHALLLENRVAIVMNNGKIVCGKTKDIMTEERLREVYDVELYLLSIDKLKRTACLPPEL